MQKKDYMFFIVIVIVVSLSIYIDSELSLITISMTVIASLIFSLLNIYIIDPLNRYQKIKNTAMFYVSKYRELTYGNHNYNNMFKDKFYFSDDFKNSEYLKIYIKLEECYLEYRLIIIKNHFILKFFTNACDSRFFGKLRIFVIRDMPHSNEKMDLEDFEIFEKAYMGDKSCLR